MDQLDWQYIILSLLAVLGSLALHEWGHAAVADLLGDPTPRSQGRVTPNPLAHIDLIGTVLIPLLGALGVFGGFSMIGWAKPVQCNPSYFKHRNFDSALVTLAGPGMNLVLACFATVGLALVTRYFPALVDLFNLLVMVNVALMIFNLLPIPPLDGSKFLMYWLGMSEETYMRISRFGGIALLVLINLKPFRAALGVAIYHTTEIFHHLAKLMS